MFKYVRVYFSGEDKYESSDAFFPFCETSPTVHNDESRPIEAGCDHLKRGYIKQHDDGFTLYFKNEKDGDEKDEDEQHSL